MTKTIYEIARLSGVSTGTVSRVVNNRPGVHPETRARVEAIVAKFKYQPSAMARGLQKQRTDTVMLLVPDVADMYYPQLIRYMGMLCWQQGKRMLLGGTEWNPVQEAGYLRQAMTGAVDGVIISPVGYPENRALYQELANRQFPVVTIENACEGIGFPAVMYDDVEGARAVVANLFSLGHRRIAFCAANLHVGTIHRRQQGYLKGCTENGLFPDPRLMIAGTQGLGQWPTDLLLGLLRGPNAPTALMFENDWMALRVSRILERNGVRVPADVSVVGFDDSYPELLGRKLASVAIPWWALCDVSLSTLTALIDGAPADPVHNLATAVLPGESVARISG